jgi:hypothetical protein
MLFWIFGSILLYYVFILLFSYGIMSSKLYGIVQYQIGLS